MAASIPELQCFFLRTETPYTFIHETWLFISSSLLCGCGQPEITCGSYPSVRQSWEESLFPDIPKQHHERFLKKGLRSVEELFLAWNNQKAVPELQGGIAKKVQMFSRFGRQREQSEKESWQAAESRKR